MLAAGEWRPTAEAQDPGTIGFHISALYSPVGWFSWEHIARLCEAATTDEAKRSFKNSVLGETWIETGEAPDWQRLYERREAWQIGTVPSGGLFLTAGADVQKDRIEVDVWAWGRGLESWLVDHIVIEGGPEHAETWGELGLLLDRTWPHAARHADRPREARHRHRLRGAGRLCLGARAWVTRRSRRSRASRASTAPRRSRARPTSTSPKAARSCAAARGFGRSRSRPSRARPTASCGLSAPTDEEIAAGATCPAGYVHLPRGAEAEWVKQLVAEQLVTVKTKRGFSRLEWQKLRERNEALDCRVYARAAAWIAGADRWTEAMWRNLEQQIELSRQRGRIDRAHRCPADGRRDPTDPATPWPAGISVELSGLMAAMYDGEPHAEARPSQEWHRSTHGNRPLLRPDHLRACAFHHSY